jgi:D-methionine transport system substrate-binding protein
MKIRKFIPALLALVLAVGLFAGCANNGATTTTAAQTTTAGAQETTTAADDQQTTTAASTETVTIKVGATPAPHAEILEQIKALLAGEGVNLEIVEFTDYPMINTALNDGSIDANFFQHKPYMEDFNTKNNAELVAVAEVHYEPMGIFAGKTKSLEELQDGATIAVPNDTTNEPRALLLLEAQGLIKLKEGAGVNATKLDITENPKNLKIEELAAEQLPRALADVDLAVINGNYALQAGLKVTDALATEAVDSLAADTYVNVLTVRKGDENRPEIQKLIKALTSDTVRDYISNTYEGSVVPKF